MNSKNNPLENALDKQQKILKKLKEPTTTMSNLSKSLEKLADLGETDSGKKYSKILNSRFDLPKKLKQISEKNTVNSVMKSLPDSLLNNDSRCQSEYGAVIQNKYKHFPSLENLNTNDYRSDKWSVPLNRYSNNKLQEFSKLLQGINNSSLITKRDLSTFEIIFPKNYLLSKKVKELTESMKINSFIQTHTFNFSDVTASTLSKVVDQLNANVENINDIDINESSQALEASDSDININVNITLTNSLHQLKSSSHSTRSLNWLIIIINLFLIILSPVLNAAEGDIGNYMIETAVTNFSNVLADTGVLSPKGYVATTQLPVYSGHTLKARILRKLPFKEEVTIIKHQGKWSKIKIALPNDAYYGWVQTRYLDVSK